MSSNSHENAEGLPQDEIDLLLNDEGDTSAEAAPQGDPGSDILPYDFSRPARISRDRKRSLEAIYGLLAKSLEGWLVGRVREALSLELQSVEQQVFGEFIAGLPSPCTSYIVDLRGTVGQQGLINFGHDFAFFLVDRLLGGTGQPVLLERTLTPTERLLVRIVAERVAVQLSEVWQDHVELDLMVSGFESVPEMLRIANHEDPVLVATLGVTMGDMTSPLTLILPFQGLEKFFTSISSRKAQVAQGSAEERTVERHSVEETLRSARIPVQARFSETSLTLGELASLDVGSVLKTDLTTDAKLFIYVAGQKRFEGTPGKMGRSLAALVEFPLEPEPDDLIHPMREGT